MWIFISRLPKETSRKDVVQFINRALTPGWLMLPLTSRARLTQCEMMQIVDRDTGQAELHGLAKIEPGKMVPGIIERLNGAHLKGRRLDVHQYRHRSPNKDPRTPGWRARRDGGTERRGSDRRRPRLNIEMLRSAGIGTGITFGYRHAHY
ncbi:MAG: hypothetical protein AB2807_00050 [Candidatus Sedimenticola endophacoides]